MLTIKLIRHGQSRANVGEVDAKDVGDHTISLTEAGEAQARKAGATLGRDYLDGSLVYASPYQRTRQTLAAVIRCGRRAVGA